VLIHATPCICLSDSCLYVQHRFHFSRFQCYTTCTTTTTQSFSNQGKTLQAISHTKQTENTLLNAYSPRYQTSHSCVYAMWYNEKRWKFKSFFKLPAPSTHTTALKPLEVWVILSPAPLINSLSPEARKWVSWYLDLPDLVTFLPDAVKLLYRPL
jgi:hypothetical protein